MTPGAAMNVSRAARGAVLPGRAAQGHGAHPVAPGAAALAALLRSAEAAGQGGHRVGRDPGHAAVRGLPVAGHGAHARLPRAHGLPGPLNGAGDVILLIYLLTLSGICTLLAGLAAGSTYSLVGISREMMTMIALEPCSPWPSSSARCTPVLPADAVLNGSVYAAGGFPWSGSHAGGDAALLPGVCAARAVRYLRGGDGNHGRSAHGILRAEAGAVQVRADGQAGRLQRAVCRAVRAVGIGPAVPARLADLLGKGLRLVLLVTLVAATHARYRIDQAIRYFACCCWCVGAWCALGPGRSYGYLKLRA